MHLPMKAFQQKLLKNKHLELNNDKMKKNRLLKKQKIFKLNMKSGLGRTLLFWFLALALVPLLIVSIINYINSYNTIHEDAKTFLTAVSSSKTEYIEFYFNRIFTDLKEQSNNVHNVDFLNKLDDEYKKSSKSLNDFVKSYRWVILDDEYGQELKGVRDAYGFYDIFLIGKEGDILFSVAQETDLGTNLYNGKYSNTKFAKSCRNTYQSGKTGFSDFEIYAPSNNEPGGFITSLIVDEYGDKIGVIAFQVSIEQINQIVQESSGLEKTVEIYLIGSDLKMRSNLSRHEEATLLKKTINTEQTDAWQKVHAIKGQIECDHNPNVYIGPNGNKVLGVHSNIVIMGVPFGLIAEIDESEAFVMISRLNITMIFAFIITVIIVGIAAVIVSNKIAKPIHRISDIADKSADGEVIDITEDLNRKDEIGTMMQSFSKMNKSVLDMTHIAEKIADGDLTVTINPRSEKDSLGKALETMAKNIKQQIIEIQEGINVLSSSSSEIMSSSSQLAMSAAQSASSIEETSFTVERMRQNSVSISEKGTHSVIEMTKGMNGIQSQMSSIADTVVKLSELSQTIGQITATVNDIAEQSNLLAVNAAIEAAKAGEHGKGFAVVAQEIKNLAERSKNSTKQVRGVLNDIQKSISTAVMATEQGNKTVETGLKLSTEAGKSIDELSSSIEETTQLSTQMEIIKEASLQIVTATKQTESSVNELYKLGEKLNKIMKQYKLTK